MVRLASIPEMKNTVIGLIAALERDGDHWDLVLIPQGDTMTTALKPLWSIRTQAFVSHDAEEITALEMVFLLSNSIRGLCDGYHEACDRCK
jgi:hypothetical protein